MWYDEKMCGIAGILGSRDLTKATLGDMLSAIRHRGPDDQGELYEEKFAFGMRRLSIIDLAGGHQPIWNEDGTIAIIFNGEIYNHLELHEELVKAGHVFKTKSDTEAILHLYEQYAKRGEAAAQSSGDVGPTNPAEINQAGLNQMLNRLRGMFGFAIFDKNVGPEGSLVIARDFFGIKPIYYRTDQYTGGKIESFGSEIKSLLKDSRYRSEINHVAINNYLSFQFNPLDESFFKGIFKLKPGSVMTVDLSDGSFCIREYWHYEFKDGLLGDTGGGDGISNYHVAGQFDIPSADLEAKLALKIHETMEDSVRHHMISDVPVGAFLSGGVDSAITVTLMQRERERLGLDKVKTFTIGFDEVSEHETAREVSDSLHTDHHEIKVSFDEYLNELPQIAWHFDEPVADPSAVALYFLAREARKHVKVVLSGEGADELFGGYNIYREPFALRPITALPHWMQAGIVRPIVRGLLAMPFNFFGKNYLRRAITPFNERYIGNAYVFRPAEALSLWKKDLGNEPGMTFELAIWIKSKHVLPADVLGRETELGAEGFVNQNDSRKMQLVDINYWLRGDILQKADKMTMAHSLELRVPYLDREVAALSETIPDSLKYKDGKTKYILRKAFESILPKTTAERRKLGFPTPVKHWLKQKPDEIRRIIFNNEYVKKYFDPAPIEKLFADHASGRAENSRKIYVLLMLAIWYNQYID
jgi:asparagine synthase (glutamine-hydrolysing)